MKYFEQPTSSTLCSVLYILFMQNQVPYFKAVTDTSAAHQEKKNVKKKCI